jgi:hypothetical protein
MPGGGGQFRIAKDEILVLEYDPERQAYWDVVKDLGGHSVFVGKNQPVVLRPEDAPGGQPNVFTGSMRGRGTSRSICRKK